MNETQSSGAFEDVANLVTTVQPTWAVSPVAAVLIAGACAAIVFAVYWHERGAAHRLWKSALAGIRMALCLLILMMLYGWTIQRHQTDRPDVVLILDDSASMGIVDPPENAARAAEIHRRLAALKMEEATRLNLAKAPLLLDRDVEWLRALDQRFHLRYYLAGEAARSLVVDNVDAAAALGQVSADQSASRLGNCIHDVLQAQAGRSTAAIVAFTDGITTDGKSLADAAQIARRKGVPLFFVGLGSDRPQRDLRIEDVVAEDAVFVGDAVHLDVKLKAEGYTGNAVVRLTRVGVAETLAEATVNLPRDGTAQTVRLSHRADDPGEFEYAVEVLPREGEANVSNNKVARKVVVRDEVVRVLLVQAYPSFEFRFLKQMLLRELNRHQSASEKAAGFRTVLQEADLEYTETDKTAERAFPVSREELFQYDVLIFGDVNPALLSPSIMNNIYEFVTVRGGGVIFIAGQRYMPLAYRDTPIAALLPMNLDEVNLDKVNLDKVTAPNRKVDDGEPFRPRLTALGASNPMLQLADQGEANQRLWNESLAPLRWLMAISGLRPGVRVLAEHPTRRGDRGEALPVITLHFIGRGKVAFQATDETHRWRLRVGDVYFARYWVQTIRYLCSSKLLAGQRAVELLSDRKEYRRGEEVNLSVRFLEDRLAPAADDGVAVVLESDAGQRRHITLHRQASERGFFQGSAGALPAGRYRVSLAAPSLSGELPLNQFVVAAPAGEFSQTQMDSVGLREAAKISLGRFYTWETAGRLLADLPAGRPVRVDSTPPAPLWNSAWIAGAFVALIALEWLMRKRVGLL